MSNQLKRSIQWRPAFDMRDSNPSKNYGTHGMECLFILSGPKGATQFVIFTNWQLDHVEKEQESGQYRGHAMGADVGYHAKHPKYEGQSSRSDCALTGGLCFYEGSSLAAEELFTKFKEQGEEVVWAKLQEWYDDMPEETGVMP